MVKPSIALKAAHSGGQNLFHSFQEFNVRNGQSVYFANPTDVRNILTRVTGNNISNIQGTLGVDGSANLFLMNPNGIVFGQNARLDVAGSFVGTTANAIGFGDRGFFSATNPENVLPLLTIQPSAFLFNQIAVSNIVVNSNAPSAPGSSFLGLRVPNGQNLLLLGGNVDIDGGQLNAFGGRVEIGAVAGVGAIGLNADDSFSFPVSIPRANVSFTNGSRVDVRLDTAGSIDITAGNVDVLNRSFLLAGIRSGYESPDSQAGNLTLNAIGRIQVGQTSLLGNLVSTNANGKGGDLNITAGSLFVTGGAELASSSFGQGNAGSVIIYVTDRIIFDGTSIDGQSPSGAFSTLEQGAIGRAGNVDITTGSLSVINGAQLDTNTNGQGNAGSIIIHATNRVSLDGRSSNGRSLSRVRSTVEKSGVGQGGNVDITTGSLLVTNGVQLQSGTSGQGNAGNVVIRADRVLFDNGFALSTVEKSGAGQGGNVSTVEKSGAGQGGNVDITTGSLSVINGAQLQSSTSGQGNAGSVVIHATDRVFFDGSNTAAFSRVEQEGVGRGGNVKISTGSLSVTNGAGLTASTFGRGDAGSVIIHARDHVSFDGISANGQFSGATSRVEQGGVGRGNNIEISAGSLSLTQGAQLQSGTFGTGRAGSIVVRVRDRVLLDGSAVSSAVQQSGVGQGGDIEISTGSLFLTHGAQLVAATLGQGNAGGVTIRASRSVLLTNTNPITGRSSAIFSRNFSATTGQGGRIRVTTPTLTIANGAVVDARTSTARPGGNVTINTGILNILNGGQITTSARSTGRSGNIALNADRITISGRDSTFARRQTQFPTATLNVGQGESGLFTNTDRNSTGRAGDINIRTRQLNIRDNAEVAVNSRGTGQAGNLTVSANNIRLDRGTLTAETRSTSKQDGANIRLQEIDRLLYLQDGSQISARAFDRANGGNVTINASNGFVIARTGANQNNDIIAKASGGNGGQVSITAQGILGLEQRPSTPANTTNDIDVSSDQGLQGTVTLNIPNVDPSRGLIELPIVPTDISNQIATACPTTAQEADRLGSFIVSGRGGIPPSPIDLLSEDNTLTEWVTPSAIHPHAQLLPVKTETAGAIVEAQGLALSPEGKVMLIAPAQASPSQPPSTCQQK